MNGSGKSRESPKYLSQRATKSLLLSELWRSSGGSAWFR